MSYEGKIKSIITIYNITLDEFKEDYKSLLEEGEKEVSRMKKTPLLQEIKTQLDQMRQHMDAQGANLNNQMKVMIEEIRSEILSEDEVSQSADHATRVANAIEFIKLEGGEINDDIAYTILKDFRNDLDTMQLFKRIVGKYVDLEDMNGVSMFPKTFGKINTVSHLLNVIEEMQGISAYLFEEPLKSTGMTHIVYDHTFVIPGLKTFRQVEGEQLIVKLAKELDDYHE